MNGFFGEVFLFMNISEKAIQCLTKRKRSVTILTKIKVAKIYSGGSLKW